MENYIQDDKKEMAMLTRKFKKFFKKAKENSKKKTFSKARNSDMKQFTGCFKCGKHDYTVKNCFLLKQIKRVKRRGVN